MQKDFPKCSCGQDVYVEEVMVPVYDDGGSVDCFVPDLCYYDKCGDCYAIASEEQIPGSYASLYTDEDELPF